MAQTMAIVTAILVLYYYYVVIDIIFLTSNDCYVDGAVSLAAFHSLTVVLSYCTFFLSAMSVIVYFVVVT